MQYRGATLRAASSNKYISTPALCERTLSSTTPAPLADIPARRSQIHTHTHRIRHLGRTQGLVSVDFMLSNNPASSANTSAHQSYSEPPSSQPDTMRATFRSRSTTPRTPARELETSTPRPDKAHERDGGSPPVIYESAARPPRAFPEDAERSQGAAGLSGIGGECACPRCSVGLPLCARARGRFRVEATRPRGACRLRDIPTRPRLPSVFASFFFLCCVRRCLFSVRVQAAIECGWARGDGGTCERLRSTGV